MATIKRKGFFGQSPARPEDELARQQDVEALIVPRRTVVQDLPVERIRPNPYQARKQFDNLEELSEAIKTQGFTSRLRVRPDPGEEGYFQLVYGERRLRAAIMAGRSEVPCEIAEHTDEELIEIGLAENIQRQDLTPIEEAEAFQIFIRDQGYSIRSLAGKIGKDKSYVQDRLEILKVPEDVKAMVAQRSDTLRAAREIAKLATFAERKPLIEGVIEGKLNALDVRTAIAQQTKPVELENSQDIQEGVQGENDHEPLSPDLAISQKSGVKKIAKKEKKDQPSFDHQIESDGRFFLSTLARWKENLPNLSEKQKRLMAFYLQQLAPDLESLKSDLEK